ncbi:hypothetical protein R1sor_006783 [Riccia sorocarpa]|uniref:DNA mismatch repair proteins mutS family domain-containing protein n=1 Tax=Riccia sorocarpa TaxID=122646 RepID=A0ABD3HS14_9MARC
MAPGRKKGGGATKLAAVKREWKVGELVLAKVKGYPPWPAQGSFVPNDIELGRVSESRNVPHAMLLTGPNMGGKSTLLRATCLAVILAQLGCYVPGEASILSPVDMIFTRLGASDRIMAGENLIANSSIQVPSWVECNEASSVLNHATSDIFDELGRGTSTYDLVFAFIGDIAAETEQECVLES